MAMVIVRKARLVVVETDPIGSAIKTARLTSGGIQVQHAYQQRLKAIEKSWNERFGATAVSNLREALEALAGDSEAKPSPLFRALEPYPEGWRASVRKTPQPCPTFPWCCIAADSPTAASPSLHQGACDSSSLVVPARNCNRFAPPLSHRA